MESKRDMQFWIIDNQDIGTHWHPEMEILFVINGNVQLRMKEHSLLLRKEDIFLINSSQLHGIHCLNEALACCVKYPWQMVANLMGSSASFFVCNSVEDSSHSYHSLREIFHELIYYKVREPHKTDCMLESLMLRLLDCLLEQYLVEPQKESNAKLNDNGRLQQVLQYVNQNYNQNVSLSTIAEELYLSPSTLSRFFKKQTGIGFVDYLNQVRIRSALSDLIQTDGNITKIAVDNGFSNLSVFNRLFKEQYGVNPTDYRKEHQKSPAVHKSTEQLTLKRVQEKLKSDPLFLPAIPLKREEEKVAVFINGNLGKPYQKHWNRVINIGSMGQLSMANLQNHLLYLTDELHFQYARIWNIFSKQMILSDGKQLKGFNYQNIDTVLDFLVSHHIRPWMDFGRRPNTITLNENAVVFQMNEYITFESRRSWEYLLINFICHVIMRFGKEEVQNWVFEMSTATVSNESYACYSNGSESYSFFEAYHYFYRIVHEYLPNAEIGGFATIPDWDTAMTQRMMYLCTEKQCIPDFFSIELFPCAPVHPVPSIQEPEPLGKQVADPRQEEKLIALAKKLMKEAGWSNTKLYVIEWGISLSNRNFLNDSCYRSAIMAQKLASIWDSVDLLGVFFGSDLLGSHYDTYRVANGNGGLITHGSIRKPVFFLMQFLNSLGDFLVDKRANYIITRTLHKNYYILCFNPKRLCSQYYLKEEQEFSPAQIQSVFDNLNPLELTITLDGMPADTSYTIKRWSINEEEGMILREWERFQYEEQLEEGDIRYLRDACYPRMSMKKAETVNAKLQIKETLQANEVVLLHIYKKP